MISRTMRNNIINNIKYRENIIRGTITKVNDNDTYSVRFKCEDKSYPLVPTYAINSNFNIGDRVTVAFENRNREMPKILAFASNNSHDVNDQLGPQHSDWILTAPAIYVVYKKTSDSKYYLVKINDDDSVTAISELPELAVGTVPEVVRILTDNSGNVYALKQTESGLNYVHTMYKYNSSGVLQVTKILAENEMYGFITSDYLYTMISVDDEVHKRSLTTLDTEDTISLTAGHRFYYLCFDSSGYLYTYDRDYPGEAAFIKWEVGTGIVDFHQQGLGSLSAWADWALLGTNIACDYPQGGLPIGAVFTFSTILNADIVVWAMNDIPRYQAYGVTANQDYWYVLGQNTAGNKLIIEKYNSAKVLQATIDVSADYVASDNNNAITAYPF